MLISVIFRSLTTINSSARSSKCTNSVYVPRKKRAREPTTEDILESTKRNPTGLYTSRVDIVITEYDLSTRSWEKIAQGMSQNCLYICDIPCLYVLHYILL